MSTPPPDEQFVRNITAYQHRLYGLILCLLPDPESARDVLQETNVVLWRKAGEFDPGSDFGAWASKVAHLQVMAFRTKRGRDRHVFDDDLIQTLARDSNFSSDATDERTVALEACLESLPVADRELLHQRYSQDAAVKEMASRRGKSATALRVTLFRLRHALLECVERRLSLASGTDQ